MNRDLSRYKETHNLVSREKLQPASLCSSLLRIAGSNVQAESVTPRQLVLSSNRSSLHSISAIPFFLILHTHFQMTQMASNQLFQYSLALGLMDGVANKGLSISEFLKHGDHGLGTFRFMNGEMIVIDSKAYQMLADGSIVDLDPAGDAIHPFAQITRFEPQITAKTAVPSKEELNDIVSSFV